jgi:hypothetical protein
MTPAEKRQVNRILRKFTMVLEESAEEYAAPATGLRGYEIIEIPIPIGMTPAANRLVIRALRKFVMALEMALEDSAD